MNNIIKPNEYANKKLFSQTELNEKMKIKICDKIPSLAIELDAEGLRVFILNYLAFMQMLNEICEEDNNVLNKKQGKR